MTGRPRSFDRDEALQLALEAFWARGYDGVSIADLTRSMGIAAPSLYAAFGDKRRLFDEATALYLDDLERERAIALDAPSAKDGIARVLRECAVHHTARETPRGCLVMSEPHLAHERRRNREVLAERIRRGQDQGDVPLDADADAMADFVDLIIAGMSARARDGASREQLDASVDLLLAAWPTGD